MSPFRMSMIVGSIILLVLGAMRKVPLWVTKVYLITFAIMLLGAELWMSLGLVNGESYSDRASDRKCTISSVINAVIMSAGDGLIGVLQVYIVRQVLGHNAFDKWNPKALALMLLIGVGQNIPVTYIMRKDISVGKISWAPLMPIQCLNIIQIQEAWILQSVLMYGILVKFNKTIFQ